MNMIERVSAAIYRKFEDRPLYAQRQMNVVLSEELARAAIEAMREPTEQLLDSGSCYEDPDELYARLFDFGTRTEGDIAGDVWRAMIDACLASKEET